MDHQQNYEYNDPSSYGFMNSFAGTEGFSLNQPQQEQQQMNGKEPNSDTTALSSLTAMHNFDSISTTASGYNSEPAPFETPSTFDTSLGFQNLTPEMPPKDQIFTVNPTNSVPNDIIQNLSSTVCQSELESHPVKPSDPVEDSKQSNTENLDKPAEDLSPKPSTSVFSPEQNSMMKALGVMRKEVLASTKGSKKRRRRILQLNEDDSDDENELKKQLLQDSPEKEKEQVDRNKATSDSDSDDPSNVDPEALKARYLLKSAIRIQGPESKTKKKKRKKRVLESDDEDELQTSLDDIGLVDSNEHDDDNDDDFLCNDIIVSEPVFASVEENEKPAEHQFVVPAPPPPLKSEQIKDDVELPGTVELKPSDPKSVNEEELKDDELETDEPSKSLIKNEDNEDEIDPSLSVEAILEKIKPMADDDEFFKAGDKSDDSDCQVVSNEDYFGSPDLAKPQKFFTGRKRGARPGVKRSSRSDSGPRKRSNKYEKDFVDGSSESDDTSFSEPSSDSSDSSTEEAPRPTMKTVAKKTPVFIPSKSFTVTNVPTIKRKMVKKDRFYDKSRDIPNDVYFGDVNVPLHVLHTRWDADAESPGSSPERLPLSKPISSNRYIIPGSSRMTPSFSYTEQSDDPKLSNLKEFVKITGIKINYGKLFDGVRSTDEKCNTIRRIFAHKGMIGEPNVAKCKKLRLEIQAKRESAELDKSVIIRAEGRTRRATRNVSSSSPFSLQPSGGNNAAVVMPETLQTLSKIRRVVDSDSE